jgi:HK97 family phage portal protein
MGLIENIRASGKQKTEKRVLGGVNWQPWSSWETGGNFAMGGPAHPSQANNVVTSTEGALALPALFAGTKILASNAASLPIKLYTTASTTGSGRVRYVGPSIFDNPSVDGTIVNWIFTAMVSLILRGNAWGLITGRDGFGFPTGIEWIPAEFVSVQPNGDQPFNIRATKVYAYGRQVSWYGPEAEVFHVKAFSIPGRLEGLSLIQLHGLTILQGKMAADFGLKYFQSGGQPHGAFQNSQMEVDAAQSAAIRKMLVNTMRTGEPLVYGNDWDYTPFKVTAEESQYIQTIGMNATQIAALLDLPPEKVGGLKGSMTYSSTIQSQLAVVESLRVWLALLESAFSTLIPANRTVTFDVRAMLRTDPLTEAQIEQMERDTGTLTADEIRELHDRAPLPRGVGSVALPGVVLTALARGAKASPRAYANELDFAAEAPPAVPADGPQTAAEPSEGQGTDDQLTTAAEAVRRLLRGDEAA